jgi:predicted PurR-regulated permease PerM|nr:MAG TPA: protein of unknown function (DUF4491) [Caudoviricetes sp.]
MSKINWRSMALAIVITLVVVGLLIAFAYYFTTGLAVFLMLSVLAACVWSIYEILEDGQE